MTSAISRFGAVSIGCLFAQIQHASLARPGCLRGAWFRKQPGGVEGGVRADCECFRLARIACQLVG